MGTLLFSKMIYGIVVRDWNFYCNTEVDFSGENSKKQNKFHEILHKIWRQV